MGELKDRFEQLKRLPAPDLQRRIQASVQRLNAAGPSGSGPRDPSRDPAPGRLLTVWLPQVLAAALIAAFGIGLAVILHNARISAPASQSPIPSTTPGIVAWVDRPVPAYSPPPRVAPYTTSAPRCLASQLRASAGPNGVGGGHQLQGITLSNVGPTCLLDGRPVVTGLNAAGQRVTLSPSPNSFFVRLQPADISQGAQGYIYFGTAGLCGSDAEQHTTTEYRAVAFDLPSGGRLSSPLTLRVGSCGLTMDNMGLPPRAETYPSPQPGSLGTLTVRVDLPATVRAGDTLHYTVALSNPTAIAVSLSNCPSYTEFLGYPNNRELTFMLNCDRVTMIPPRTNVVYAMEFSIPADAVKGQLKFTWHLNDPDGASAGGVLTIS